jgi:hypothetical protein
LLNLRAFDGDLNVGHAVQWDLPSRAVVKHKVSEKRVACMAICADQIFVSDNLSVLIFDKYTCLLELLSLHYY